MSKIRPRQIAQEGATDRQAMVWIDELQTWAPGSPLAEVSYGAGTPSLVGRKNGDQHYDPVSGEEYVVSTFGTPSVWEDPFTTASDMLLAGRTCPSVDAAPARTWISVPSSGNEVMLRVPGYSSYNNGSTFGTGIAVIEGTASFFQKAAATVYSTGHSGYGGAGEISLRNRAVRGVLESTNSGDRVVLYCDTTTSTAYSLNGGPTFPAGTTLELVVNGNSVGLYRNGVLLLSGTTNSAVDNTTIRMGVAHSTFGSNVNWDSVRFECSGEVPAYWKKISGVVTATEVRYNGSTNLAATNVEAALDELDAEKAPAGHIHTPARSSGAAVTPALANGASADLTLPLAKSFRAYFIKTSRAARVRLYATAAHRTADAARPVTERPRGNHGVLLEYVTTPTRLSGTLSPQVDGSNLETTPTANIAMAVTNLDVDGAVSVTINFFPTET